MRAVRFHDPAVPQGRFRVHGGYDQGLDGGILQAVGVPTREERHWVSPFSREVYANQEEAGEGDWSDMEFGSPSSRGSFDDDIESMLRERGLQLCNEGGYPSIRPLEGCGQEGYCEVSESEATDVPCERCLPVAKAACEDGEEGSRF